MDIVITGRNVEVPEHFRDHTTEKTARLERYDHKIIRFVVEISHEPNPRRSKSCQRVQITGCGRGPVVRAEGCAADFHSALDLALGRLEERLRRAHDRRRVHHGRRQPLSVARATAGGTTGGPAGGTTVLERPADPVDDDGTGPGLPDVAGPPEVAVPAARRPLDDEPPPGTAADDYEPGRVARRKEHPAAPMTVDEALSRMELVGHDFYLFSDVESGRPSVVYRRRAYDYGVIALV